MADEEQSGFTVVDKRNVSDSAEAGSPEAAPTAADPDEAADPTPDTHHSSPSGMPRLTVRDRLLMCIDILYQGSWIAMGLIADPATGEVERDLEKARLAIDSVAFLAEKLDTMLDDAARREIRNLVATLRMNYVEQTKR